MNSKQVEHLEITLALTPGSFDDDAMEQQFNQAPLNSLENITTQVGLREQHQVNDLAKDSRLNLFL